MFGRVFYCQSKCLILETFMVANSVTVTHVTHARMKILEKFMSQQTVSQVTPIPALQNRPTEIII